MGTPEFLGTPGSFGFVEHMKKRHEQKLVILSLALLLAFNLPLVLLFDHADAILGIPVIYGYFFSIWIFSIVVSFLVVKRYYE